MNTKITKFPNSQRISLENSIIGFPKSELPAQLPTITEHWGDYLNTKDWQLWTTFTTQKELTIAGARRAMIKLYYNMIKRNFPIQIFWVAEPFDVKEGYHLHALISFFYLRKKDNNNEAYTCLLTEWRSITNQDNARVRSERYLEQLGANYYLGKYMMKIKTDMDYFQPGMIATQDMELHNEDFCPTLNKQFKNKLDKISWLKEQRSQAKIYKAEIKTGNFTPRDNTPHFKKNKVYQPFYISQDNPRYPLHNVPQKNDYGDVSVTIEGELYNEYKETSRNKKQSNNADYFKNLRTLPIRFVKTTSKSRRLLRKKYIEHRMHTWQQIDPYLQPSSLIEIV